MDDAAEIVQGEGQPRNDEKRDDEEREQGQARIAVLAVAGMEGALFSVLAGLVSAPVIAVPTSIGYGVGRDGRAALSSALASCAPGIVTVNVDNGFGAAVACVKMLQAGQPGDDRKLV